MIPNLTTALLTGPLREIETRVPGSSGCKLAPADIRLCAARLAK